MHGSEPLRSRFESWARYCCVFAQTRAGRRPARTVRSAMTIEETNDVGAPSSRGARFNPLSRTWSARLSEEQEDLVRFQGVGLMGR